jgi:hypothetical protein
MGEKLSRLMLGNNVGLILVVMAGIVTMVQLYRYLKILPRIYY